MNGFGDNYSDTSESSETWFGPIETWIVPRLARLSIQLPVPVLPTRGTGSPDDETSLVRTSDHVGPW